MDRKPARRTVLAASAAVALPGALCTVPAAASTASAPDAEHEEHAGHGDHEGTIQYHAWHTVAGWISGAADGTRVQHGPRPALEIGHPTGRRRYHDPHTGETHSWETAQWTSPEHLLGFGATELVGSFNAHTPRGTWIEVTVRGRYQDGEHTPWYVLARWAFADSDIKRTSVQDQSDGRSAVNVDTLAVSDENSHHRLVAYRLRVTLLRAQGSSATPSVHRLGAMASLVPDRFTPPRTRPGSRGKVELSVPRYSQEIHEGEYPEYDGGGEAWCSPTSSEMVLEYYGHKPTRDELSWVNPKYDDPTVDHAARYTYDYQYEGCGNWPFNAAYVSHYPGMQAVVTRLRSLRDVEDLNRVGIPVITSQSFEASELDGAGYGTAGHLMVIIGFTAHGDVIANDPASDANQDVRRVYHRRQFETIWLRTKRHTSEGEVAGGTGGVCYVYFPVKSAPSQRAVLRELGIE